MGSAHDEHDVAVISLSPVSGVEEGYSSKDTRDNNIATIYNGPLHLPAGDSYTIFDITGRKIHSLNPAPGVYFIEVDGKITQKIIKIK